MKAAAKEKETHFLLIDEKVLPDVFNKVITVKQMLLSGEAASTSEAVRIAGISRSVFYKYKDSVFPYANSKTGGIITVQTLLLDKPGVLMNVLSQFYSANANILTVNQNIPIAGRASVSISAQIDQMNCYVDTLLSSLMQVDGVIKIENISDN